MDAIILNAASENVTRMMKKVTGRMGIDKSSGHSIDATAKKDKDKAVKALTRNLAKCSHSNPIIAADFLIYHVSCSRARASTFSITVPVHCQSPAHLSNKSCWNVELQPAFCDPRLLWRHMQNSCGTAHCCRLHLLYLCSASHCITVDQYVASARAE